MGELVMRKKKENEKKHNFMWEKIRKKIDETNTLVP